MNLKITTLRTAEDYDEAIKALVISKGDGEDARTLRLDADDALTLLDWLLLHARQLDRARSRGRAD